MLDELEREQRYVDEAYRWLDRTRAAVRAMRDTVEDGPGGTFAARFERDVIWDRMASRVKQLELGSKALCFGRIDHEPDGAERLYIGRLAVLDDGYNPVIVDWRADAAEPFYRATASEPMGLMRRRHFTSRGRTLVALDDELFGSAAAALDQGDIQGEGALIAALESARSGRLSDIVATIQGEQDEVIRSPWKQVLVVQGGPGTGKTVVALHRAAYLLYTHRFPLEGQVVLVLGPNRLFLNYIDQVLPSLGEAGAEVAVLGDLIPEVSIGGHDRTEVAHVKGDPRMAKVLRRAVRDRQRMLPEDLVVDYGGMRLRFTVRDSREVRDLARSRVTKHNAGRKIVEAMFWDRLVGSARRPVERAWVVDALSAQVPVRMALERMWPQLTAPELLNDLCSSRGLLRSAAAPLFAERDISMLEAPRRGDPNAEQWTHQDAPLLDEALWLLGPPNGERISGVRTYGHIVIDEAQDLSPMELRAIKRRSLNGSYTVVGDLAQATTPWGISDWSQLTNALGSTKPVSYRELRTGYRLPASISSFAEGALRRAAPNLAPPVSVRSGGPEPRVIRAPVSLSASAADEAELALAQGDQGNVAIIIPEGLEATIWSELDQRGLRFGRANRTGLDLRLIVVPVGLVKGLEVDRAIVVEPEAMLNGSSRGAQALYVALTRPTQALSVITSGELPDFLHGPAAVVGQTA